jgi:hypothetical protein
MSSLYVDMQMHSVSVPKLHDLSSWGVHRLKRRVCNYMFSFVDLGSWDDTVPAAIFYSIGISLESGSIFMWSVFVPCFQLVLHFHCWLFLVFVSFASWHLWIYSYIPIRRAWRWGSMPFLYLSLLAIMTSSNIRLRNGMINITSQIENWGHSLGCMLPCWTPLDFNRFSHPDFDFYNTTLVLIWLMSLITASVWPELTVIEPLHAIFGTLCGFGA